MSTITKEFTKERLEEIAEGGFLKHGESKALARIALASIEAEPVAYMWDSDRKDVDAPGYYRPEHKIFAETSVKRYGGKVVALYAAPPAPVSVPDERAAFNAWNNDTDCPLAGRDAKTAAWLAWSRRAAMLQGADGNYPVIPDGWVLVPIEPTYQMCEAMGLQWESPRFPDRYKAMLAAVKK